ncbi:unnamed protein product [Owenia fusiformis]|uniref:Uncharacterized protein n=1 Tax=Owenia fusiformis TaxID=6347 RepID=A0A8J1U477_OWEFU|nr:unnamed protein product [Owenia fusiformis]
MEEIWTLILFCLVMLIGCYVAGSVPLAFTFSEEKLKLVTVLGAGLLVGTSLAVIIPEGVHMLYETPGHHDHKHVEVAIKSVDQDASKVAADEATHVHNHAEHAHSHSDPHSKIGVTLVLGFIFMLLVDQLGGGHTHASSTDTEAGVQNRHKITATLGLVVHAAADGIALGAAATTSQLHIEMIVFLAIMLHKAPAAFGLSTFLLHDGFDRPRIRKHLAVFSLAAPIMAIVTYLGLSQAYKETLNDMNATGLAMLFSAGTFLYVATVHILPELAAGKHTHSSPGNGNTVIHEHSGFSKPELFVMVIGSIVPIILSIGHSH